MRNIVNNCTRFAFQATGQRLLLLFLLLPLPVVAEMPALYGFSYYRVGEHWQDSAPTPIEEVDRASLSGSVAAYREQLESAEQDEGPYSDGLSEPLSALAALYQNDGDFQQAVKYYQQALHIVRVNDGLYSERQLPLVRGLLGIYREVGDWQGLDQRYAYFFRLYGSGKAPYTDLRMKATLEYLRWQREAFRRGVDDNPNRRLLAMYQLNDEVLASADQSPSMTAQWYEQLVRSQLLNLYLLQANIQVANDLPQFHTMGVTQPAQAQATDYQRQRLEALVRSSRARGETLLEDMALRLSVRQQPVRYAAIQLELGDWLLWNGRNSGARTAYARVIEVLLGAGEGLLLENWLGSPRELPANGVFWQPDVSGSQNPPVHLRAQYTVSSRGAARNIQVTSVDPEGEAMISRLRRELSATRFRPRFIEGEAESVKDVKAEYEFIVDS